MAQVGTSKATATSLCYSASLQRPLRLSSKPGSGLTSPSTSRSCRPLLSLGEEPRELRRVREEEVYERGDLLSPRCLFPPLQYCKWLRGSALCLPEPEDCPGDEEAEDHQPFPHEEVS